MNHPDQKKYFADIHSMPENELGGVPHNLSDTQEVLALREGESYDALMELARALCWQLRCRDAIEVYTKAIGLDPSRADAYRQRAAKYINTMQPEKAIADFQRSLELGCDRADTLYRLGIAYHLARQYEKAMESEAAAYPDFGDEMGIAAIFWHTMSAYKASAAPELLQYYRKDMNVGHHTAYRFAVSLAVGEISLDEALEQLKAEKSDLEYSMMAYGTAIYMEHKGLLPASDALLRDIVKRDGFWISYGYLAAWNDVITLSRAVDQRHVTTEPYPINSTH